MIELKDASTTVDGVHTGMSDDHATLATGLSNAYVTSKSDAIVVRLGKPSRTDFYLRLDLSGAEELVAALSEQIEWLKNPNG